MNIIKKNWYIILAITVAGISTVFDGPMLLKEFMGEYFEYFKVLLISVGLFLFLSVFIILVSSAHNVSYFAAVFVASIVAYGIYYFSGQNYPFIYLGEFVIFVIYGLWNWKKL